MKEHYEAAHLRFATRDGLGTAVVELGSLDGAHVELEVFMDDEDVLHIIVWDSVSADA